eukprot:7207634-Pyramimonas_sp.AAC.1
MCIEFVLVLLPAHQLAPLPEGYFYNGTAYVNFLNEASKWHPQIEDFAAEFLTEQNERIECANAEAFAKGAGVAPFVIKEVVCLQSHES